MDHPRGIPALSRLVKPHESVGERFRAAATGLRPLRVLTRDEFEELIGLLGPAARQDLLTGARRAVPHLSLATSGTSDVGALIEDLEDRESEPGVVPPLLQVVEEVAATRKETANVLLAWSEQVADSLGVSQGALAQCRWSARSRATACTSLPVLRVWLWAEPTADAFHYTIRLYGERGEQVRMWTDRDALRSRSELCADLSEAVDDLDQYEESAGVEFLLEEGSFGIAVDRLPTQAGALGTRPVGLDRIVVLRGQRVRRIGEWKARWEVRQLPGAGPYVVHDPDAADSTLTSRRDIACVLACCPPEHLDRTLALCRWLGVPVVLWHRGSQGADAADVLRPVVQTDWPHTLREEVRRQRAEARNDTTHVGAHLALLWEDPSWTPPQPRLSIPTRRGGGVA